MMNSTIFLIFAVLIPTKSASPQSCVIDSLINGKIQAAIDSKVYSILAKSQLICTTAFSHGANAYCPSGFQATGCSCGMACGSWAIRGDAACNCVCANIDWTSARCCKVGIAR